MRWAVATAALAIAAGLARASAEAPKAGPGVVILMAPGLRADDLTSPEMTALREVRLRGAVGWMNGRTGVDPRRPGIEPASFFLTLGSGTRALVPNAPGSWQTEPDARRIGVGRLLEANARLDHAVHIGALGDLCRRAGLRTEVIGDDSDAEPSMNGVFVAMDLRGSVDRYEPATLTDPDAPYGIRTDVARFVPNDGALTVLVFGDIARADRYADLCTPEAALRHRTAALKRLDGVIRDTVLPWVVGGERRQAWFVAPNQAATGSAERLIPVAALGGGLRSGWLTSPTTRRFGLIAAADLVPSVARLLGLDVPEHVVGRPVSSSGNGPSVAEWRMLYVRWNRIVANQRALGGLPIWRFTMLAALLGLCTASKWLRKHGVDCEQECHIRTVTQWIGAVSATVAILLAVQSLSWLAAQAESRVAAAFLAVTMLAAAYRSWRHPDLSAVLAIGSATTCIVAALVGITIYPPSVQDSWLGYSVAEGARYYGIGNEMVGALLASILIMAWPAIRRNRWEAPAVLYSAAALLLLLPFAGANFGAAVGAILMATFSACAVCRTPRQLAVTLGAVAAIAAVFAIVLSRLDAGPSATHIGAAFANPAALTNIAGRKIALNLHLITHSPWTLCLAAGFLLCLPAQPAGQLRQTRRAWALLAVGALTLLAANDSGVVAAGMALSVGAPLLIAVQNRWPEPGQPQRVGHDAH